MEASEAILLSSFMKVDDSAIVRETIPVPENGRGLGLAALGVLAFSFTMPATVWALRGFDPYLIGVGRAAVAAVFAVVALVAVRAARPRRHQWRSLAVVAGGVVFGFPVLSTLALDHGASSSHSAVVVGVLPAATAVLAVIRAGERPSAGFWLASLAGAACIVGFTLRQGAGRFTPADLLLFGALLAAAVGYVEGGRLAREMPGWQVICWALVLAIPVTVPATVAIGIASPPSWGGDALVGMAYVSGISMFLGFFAWYAGMARAGVARAGQVQLAQPLLTLVWSWLFLGEHTGLITVLAAVAVLGCVVVTQRTRVRR
jgi:drug/metabolite transporter (DMT)-like permease